MGLERDRFVRLDDFGGARSEQRIRRNLVILLQVVHAEDNFARLRGVESIRALGRNAPVNLVELETARLMPFIVRNPVHMDIGCIAASSFEVVASRSEVASGRSLVGKGKVAGYGDERPRVLVGARKRNGTEQRLRVRVPHSVENILDRSGLDGFSGIHDANPVAHFHNEAEIVRDEQHRRAVFLSEILD